MDRINVLDFLQLCKICSTLSLPSVLKSPLRPIPKGAQKLQCFWTPPWTLPKQQWKSSVFWAISEKESGAEWCTLSHDMCRSGLRYRHDMSGWEDSEIWNGYTGSTCVLTVYLYSAGYNTTLSQGKNVCWVIQINKYRINTTSQWVRKFYTAIRAVTWVLKRERWKNWELSRM